MTSLHSESPEGTVLLIGAEPAAFSCALELVANGVSVHHVYPGPLGLTGSSRDIGLCYPELGEPFERLAHALGESVAVEFHRWSQAGVESLEQTFPTLVHRGSRMAVTRTEQESLLATADAMQRSSPPLGDEVRLMSGAAVSNYGPLDGAHQGSFETHALSFLPLKVLEGAAELLQAHPRYQQSVIEDNDLWRQGRVDTSEGIHLTLPTRRFAGEIAVLATGTEGSRLLGGFSQVLLPLSGQAFRTPPLREKTRSSVVGITASWGYERYRFDEQYRLLGCGVDPSGSTAHSEDSLVNPKPMKELVVRASSLFTDFDGRLEELLQWGVTFTVSCDGLPLLGPLAGEPRIQLLTGFGLSAWSRGWEAGRRIAYSIIGRGEPSELLKRCGAVRFQLRRG